MTLIHPEWTDAAPPVIGEPFDDSPPPLVAGGQGRTDSEALDDAEGVTMFTTVLLAVLLALICVIACAWILREWGE